MELTLVEKARLCAGRDYWSLHPVPALGVPPLVVADGPYGLRKERRTDRIALGAAVPATCFPTSSALAATWDPVLVERVGAAIGAQARALGVSVVLGPGANIKRTPLCGRNFEYLSEDPHLSTTLAAAWIRGVQSVGVAASLKHLAANNQEHRRFTIDAVVDERALREIYLASFEGAVRDGRPWTVMTAYNRLNGEFCGEHAWLLEEVLRREWGFDGVVLSDWGGTNDRVAGLRAGLDLEMPGLRGHNRAAIVRAVRRGELPESVLDVAVGRLLSLAERTRAARENPQPCDPDEHHALARRAAEDATVLLKNDGGLLPLAPGARIAVLGAFAERPRFQGAGSSTINPYRVDDALTGLRELGDIAYAPGYPRHGEAPDPALLDEAVALARGADAVLVFAGLPETYETEGLDRAHLDLPPAHTALIDAVAAANPRVVVVLSNGAPVAMPWLDAVPAVVESYLGGQAGGSAVARVLFGLAEPGGRLAETFPRSWQDNPVHALPTGPSRVEYTEGVFVGYRWYDTAQAPVLFPFGHGLSYTSFAYSDLVATPAEVTVTVTNTGARPGSEVVQVYVRDVECSLERPVHELAGFAKVRLAPGEARRVPIALRTRAFAFWDDGWRVEAGEFEVRVGASSRDIRVTTRLHLPATPQPPDPPGRLGGGAARLPGGAGPARRGEYTLNTPLADMYASAVIRVLHRLIRAGARRYVKDVGSPAALIVTGTVNDLSLRMMLLLGGGTVRKPLLVALLDLANGRYVRGVRRLFPALVRLVLRR